MSIDFTKPVQTCDGRKVRIMCTDASCNSGGLLQPIVGWVEGTPQPAAWCLDGRFNPNSGSSEMDLTNIPPPKKKAKVFVELRLDREGRDLYGVATVDRQPHKADNIVLASTTVELEYEEPQP